MHSFAAGFVFGAVLVGAWFFGGSVSPAAPLRSTPSATTTANTANNTEVSASGSGAVSVADQSAGSSVTVESVTVPPPGVWVAIQETSDGTLGNVLGATRVHGPRSNVTVNLLRNTAPDRAYAVVLYRDGGDGGVFNLKVDSVYVDFDSGAPVVAPFHTLSAPDAATTSSATP